MFKKKIKFDEYDLSENDYNLLMKTYEGNLNDFLADKNSTIESLTIHFENQRLEKELNKQKPAAKTADTSILEQKIKELEAENAELKNRANAFLYNGAATQKSDAAGTNAFDDDAALAEENRRLSEAKTNLQEKNMELYKQVQDLQQKLSQYGGNRMSEEVTQWEYKTVSEATKDYKRDSVATDEKLNKMGNEGWEVAGIMNFSGTSSSFLMKRPKKTQDSDYSYSR